MVDERTEQAEALLRQIKDEDAGRLTIFLGAAPGVGKTYTMLEAAGERKTQGVDVVVGLVETHGRADTESMVTGLEVLPRRSQAYHDAQLTEFDLDAALDRRPQLILVDELAHTNVPGSRHRLRYQDIAELLSAGIDVFTTVNIQHLASLNDLVLQITGVRVRETVPDHFIDEAHELRFIDLPPATLIERLQAGKVYLPEYARSALESFFSLSNLTALRELAMREVMEHVDAGRSREMNARGTQGSVAIREKLLVLVSNNSDHRYLVRIGRQIADRRKIPWRVLWVDTGRTNPQQAERHLRPAFTLARELGADIETLRGPATYQTIVPFISKHAISTVLLGSGTRHRFLFWRKRLYQRLIESALPLEVSVISPPGEPESRLRAEPAPMMRPRGWSGHGFSVIAVALATAAAVPLEILVTNSNLVLVYVLAVVAAGLKYGWRPAITASVLAFLSFNFFLTDPRYTFEVHRQEEVATLVFLFLIALACGPAASLIRRQFILLREVNRYSEALRLNGQALSVAEDEKAVWQALHDSIAGTLDAECVIVPTLDNPGYEVWPGPAPSWTPTDTAAIEWTRQNVERSGRFSDTLTASTWSVFPVSEAGQCLACALVRFDESVVGLAPEEGNLVLAILKQGADAWRRVRLVGELESARVQSEVEQLRSALLSSVSHDLKSPLSAMMGSAESLRLLDKQLSEADRGELVDAIILESRRLESYIQNLLDMTRLGHGNLKIERDWVSMDDVVNSALARLKRYFPAVKTVFRKPAAPPLMYVHAALLEQAIFNILENAARFSPQDEVISVDLEAGGNRCFVSIEDKGPGIPEDQREKVFDMFFIVSEGDQRKQNTGMGLAICRGMVGAHGGTVTAMAGTDGIGTRFVVELPMTRPGDAPAEAV